LQMARFYALLANGGKLVKPHLVEDVEEGGGGRSPARIVHSFTAPAPQPAGLDHSYLAAVQDGLYQATHASYGTSVNVFGNFPYTIVGKTGTAQKIVNLPRYGYVGGQDQSWWCGYGPYNSSAPPQPGLWAISGITQSDIPGNSSYYLVRQGVYAAVGVVGLLVVLLIDPDYYRRFKRPIYVGTIGVMLLVLMAGTVSRHSKRWLDLGFFR